MNITDIKIRRTYQDNRLRALVSITVDGELAVHDIKVIEGPERLFVAMPSRRDDNGVFRDIAHPITTAARRQVEDSILAAYQEHMAAKQQEDAAVGHASGNHPDEHASAQ
ncbi:MULTISPECIES: septation regulator SpoVG [Anaerotruncus]|uniref:septation regulator SpoVG n=1 Tax=Anaerotruncus TaxID=244127 RepID=UPI000829CEC4|nr:MULTISPECIES: septation regulator SpoVG [Anaerotruncus]RGX51568.1 septation regulator SpoVG [Anaerotruncus sp. AF02-27]